MLLAKSLNSSASEFGRTATAIFPAYICLSGNETFLWSQLSDPVPNIRAFSQVLKLTYSSASGTALPFSSRHSQVKTAISFPFGSKLFSSFKLNFTGLPVVSLLSQQTSFPPIYPFAAIQPLVYLTFQRPFLKLEVSCLPKDSPLRKSSASSQFV